LLGERFYLIQKRIGVTGVKVLVELFLAAGVDDTGVHLVGVQIDSAVE